MLTNLAIKVITIRIVEEKLLELFSKGLLEGTTHTYIGQEATAAGVISNLNQKDDYVISNHRNHGHYICFGGEIIPFFAELLGKKEALCDGYGGSQHLHFNNFFSFGILGGTAPIACGIGLANKMKNTNGIVCIFLGDGALGQGVVYESFNMASLWKIPVFFIIENNGIAQTSMVEQSLAGSIKKRIEAFGIKTHVIKTNDVEEIYNISKTIISEIRMNKIPQSLVVENIRLGPHSKGDDTRPTELIEKGRLNDPLIFLKEKMGKNYNVLYEKIRKDVENKLKIVLEFPTLANCKK